MDHAKKTKIETAIVLGLLAGLGAVLVRGPLKSLGLFGSSRSGAHIPVTSVEKVQVAQSVNGLLREGWDKMDTQVRAVIAKPTPLPPPSAAAYTAFDARDPLKSFLPKPALSTTGAAAAPGTPEAPPPPPPQLRVEGLLWGDTQPQAIINGRVYGVQDTVNGVTITEITGSGVTVEYLGKPVVYPAVPQR